MYRMVFTQVFCRLILISVVALFTSCSSYRILEVDVLRPATIQVERGKQIALLDRNIRKKDSSVVFTDKSVEIGLIRDFARGMNYGLTEVEYDTVISLGQRNQVMADGNIRPLPLPADSIASWGKRFKVGYIVSLEMQHFELWEDLIYSKWFVRLYEAGENAPLDSMVVQSSFFLSPGGGADDVLQKLRAAYWDGGANYIQRIIPYWERTQRRMYCRGKIMGVSDALWQAGKTEEAMKLWEAALAEQNKTAIQAAINLAWACENNGDFDTALQYLQEAEQIVSRGKMNKNSLTLYAEEYLKNIQVRISQRDKLNQSVDSYEN